MKSYKNKFKIKILKNILNLNMKLFKVSDLVSKF